MTATSTIKGFGTWIMVDTKGTHTRRGETAFHMILDIKTERRLSK